ncbi:uncharacterized protein LOC117167811 [Belonocnema kinseyi]|uniref:uncharacterized protein LOC117167811 n=1 Tax=Belonocnema kinseyi TaxID=2817044 RepID=UPI00143CD30F|nr:uncharacterized protein LOC117167811 [Belonocnema kinseyi]
MVECFTFCNTVCLACLWCSLFLPVCFPKYFYKLERKSSSEFCIQRIKCKEKISSILSRCKSGRDGKSSQSEQSDSSRNQKHVKETSLNKKCGKKLSRNGMNSMGGNTVNVCRCRNCLGYEYGCQNLSPVVKMTADSKNRSELNNNHRKYRLYAKLTKETDNSKDKFLHLKCNCNKKRYEYKNLVSAPDLSQCSSNNNQWCNNCR